MAYAISLLPQTGGEKGISPSEALNRLREGLEDKGSIAETSDHQIDWTCGGTRASLKALADSDGSLREVEATIPFGAVLKEVDDVLKGLIEAAEASGLRAFDPQMGRSVGRADIPAITGRFGEASSYHVQYSGLSEDSRQGIEAASAHSHPPLVSPKFKAIGVMVLFLVVAYMILRVLVIDSFLDALSPDRGPTLDPAPGPPPGWLERHPPSGG